MTFLWSELLWTLAVLPVLVLLYLWLLRRRKRVALRYAELSLVKQALGKGQGLRRHIPPVLFLMAIAVLLVATARPMAVVTLPSQQETIILAMDVSGSMRAEDVQPTRMAAAQEAARAFLAELPRWTKVGLVTFAGTAALVQPPTVNRDDIRTAIDRFTYQRGTAVGSGVLVSLQAVFPDLAFDLRSRNPRVDTRDPNRGLALGSRPQPVRPFQPVPPGSLDSVAIVLLTDGQTTTGPDPVESARMAAERGVRVYTVGIGTPHGEIVVGDGWSMRVMLDEDSLKAIADVTRAEYFYAGTAVELRKVYESLSSRLTLEKRETEVTALFAGLAALLSLLAAGLSVLWYHRIL